MAQVGEQAVGARLVRLVLDADQALGIVLGDLADAVDLHLPHGGVVDLEAVVEAVLPEPERHQVAARLARRVDAALGEVDRLAADRRVRVGEGAELEGGVGVVAHGEAVDRQPEVADPPGDRRRGLGDVVGEVEVDVGQALDRRRALRQVERAGLARAARPEVLRLGRERVETGRKSHRLPPSAHRRRFTDTASIVKSSTRTMASLSRRRASAASDVGRTR